jgi:hypothetical protein
MLGYSNEELQQLSFLDIKLQPSGP